MVTTKDIKILDMFMQAHNIPYVLTGTAALMVHGILPEGYVADDIDIIVLVNQKEDSNKYFAVEKTLKQLELLSGEKKNTDYNSVITFRANNVKVNAFMGGKEINEQQTSCQYNYINSFGENEHYNKIMIENASFVRVSDVLCVLKAKFRLRRMKDYKFAKDLASTILNIGF